MLVKYLNQVVAHIVDKYNKGNIKIPNQFCFINREDHELGMAEVTLLSQLSLWDRDSDDDDDDAKDAENAHVQADVCDQAELQQSLNTLKLKLYKRKFYKRLNFVIFRKWYPYPFQ